MEKKTIAILFLFFLQIQQIFSSQCSFPFILNTNNGCPENYFFSPVTLCCEKCPDNTTNSSDFTTCVCIWNEKTQKYFYKNILNKGGLYNPGTDGFCKEIDPIYKTTADCQTSKSIFRQLDYEGNEPKKCYQCVRKADRTQSQAICVNLARNQMKTGIKETQCNIDLTTLNNCVLENITGQVNEYGLVQPYYAYDPQRKFSVQTYFTMQGFQFSPNVIENNVQRMISYKNQDVANCYKDCSYLVNQCLFEGLGSTKEYPTCQFLQNMDTSNVRDVLYPAKDNFNTGYTNKVSFDIEKETDGVVSILPFYIAIYQRDGKFIDFRELTTDLQICEKNLNDGKEYKKMGTNFLNACTIDLQDFLDDYESESYTYEIYLKESDGSYSQLIVFAERYQNEKLLNQMKIQRFFIVDRQTFDGFIQYAESINIIIDLVGDQAINIPYIKIKYQITNQPKKGEEKLKHVEFQVSYLYSFDGVWRIIIITFSIFMAIGIFWIVLRVYIWTKYHPSFDGVSRHYPEYGRRFFFDLMYIIVDVLADGIFYYVFGTSFFLFIFYKATATPIMLLPSQEYLPEQYIPFQIAIGISFLFKLISTAILVLKQSSCHIYFLDWEPPRKYDNGEEDKGISIWRTLFVANEFNELSVLRNISVEWSLFFLGLFMSGLEWEHTAAQQPTINRELSTDSVKINIVLKLFVGGGVLYVIGMVQLIGRQLIKIWFPLKIQDFTDFCSVANISIFLLDDYLHGYYVHGQSPDKYAEGNALWLMQCLGDEVGNPGIFDYIFGQGNMNQQQQLNNSMMNKSLQFQQMQQMILSQRGGGIQMAQFNVDQAQQQVKSQSTKRGERGLNNSNQQIFEFFLSWELREKLDKLFEIKQKTLEYQQSLSNLQKAQMATKKNAQQKQKNLKSEQAEENKSFRKEEKKEEEDEENIVALQNGNDIYKYNMDILLRNVVENMSQGSGQNSNIFQMDFLQRWLLHLPPPTHTDKRFNQNIFYIDEDYGFKNVLYQGQEYNLLMFIIITFTFFNVFTQSTLASVIITYAIDYVYKYFREELGQQNISLKGGIDDQFLI